MICANNESALLLQSTNNRINKTALEFTNAVLSCFIDFSHRLCWPAQVCVGDALGGFGVGLLDDVGVDIRGGGHGGVAEAL